MDWRKLVVFATFLLMIPAASGFTVNISVSSPNANDGFEYYNESFTVTATADGPANMTFTFDGNTYDNSSPNVTRESDSEFSFDVGVGGKEGSYTITADAVNRTNSSQTDSASADVNIDTFEPKVSASVSPSTATLTETVQINVNITSDEGFLDYVNASNDVPLPNGSGNERWGQTTPEELGCSEGTNCKFRVDAFDQSGKSDYDEPTVEIIENESQNESQPFNITIFDPSNRSGQTYKDSLVPLEIEVESRESLPSGRLCRYVIERYSEEDDVWGLGKTRDGNNLINEYSVENASTSGNTYTLTDTLKELKDGEYRLTATCWDSDGEEHLKNSSFIVTDNQPPNVRVHFTNVTETSANFTINSTEKFQFRSLSYRTEGGTTESNISFSDDYESSFDFHLDGLSPATTYILGLNIEDRADNEDTEAANFQTLGGEEEDNETQEQGVYRTLMENRSRNLTEEEKKFTGLNYTRVMSRLRKDEGEQTLDIPNFNMTFRAFSVDVKKDVRNVKLSVLESNSTPPFEKVLPSNSSVFKYAKVDFFYQEINPSRGGDEVVNYVKIRFTVDQNWLEEEGIDAENIALFRYNEEGSKWEQLPTSLSEEGILINTYEAASAGFSYFAIARQRGVEEDVSQAVEDLDTEEPEENEQQTTNNNSVSTTESPQKGEEKNEENKTEWYWYVLGAFGLLMLLLFGYYGAVSMDTGGQELEDVEAVKGHMKRLEKFVDQALEQGRSKRELREKLKDAGWDEKLVEFVLRRK